MIVQARPMGDLEDEDEDDEDEDDDDTILSWSISAYASADTCAD